MCLRHFLHDGKNKILWTWNQCRLVGLLVAVACVSQFHHLLSEKIFVEKFGNQLSILEKE